MMVTLFEKKMLCLHVDSFVQRTPATLLVGQLPNPMFGKSQLHIEFSVPKQSNEDIAIFLISFKGNVYDDIMEYLRIVGNITAYHK
jgi:hypothetical protein